MVEPEMLLLDEPLSNLDANLREEMRFEIRRLHDEFRYTTVYVTHDQAEAMVTADRIVVMNEGRIEQVGPPEDVYDRPRSQFVARFIGASQPVGGRCSTRSHLAGRRPAARQRSTAHRRPAGARSRSASTTSCLTAADPQPARTMSFPAMVIRHVFLGSARDYRGGSRMARCFA